VVMSTIISETADAGSPPVAVRDNGAVVAAALPGDADVPGYTRQPDPPRDVVVKLCPSVVETLAGDTVQASNIWRGTGADAGRWVYAVAALDAAQAPPDKLLATLMPPACPARDDDGTTYVHDRQPYERDGWTGALNTSVATTAAGARYYEATYLISKGDALVNVVAGREAIDASTAFDATADEVAARCLDTMVQRFTI